MRDESFQRYRVIPRFNALFDVSRRGTDVFKDHLSLAAAQSNRSKRDLWRFNYEKLALSWQSFPNACYRMKCKCDINLGFKN